MLIVVGAVVPAIFVVIPMVIAIIVAFAWPGYAASDEPDQRD
jgi:hypothetical protein